VRWPPAAVVAFVWIGASARLASAETSPPPGTPTPMPAAESSERLRLDIEGHVRRLLDGDPTLPRFETRVDVVAQTPQEMLERYFVDGALECGATPGGAPTVVEMQGVRETPPPAVNLLGIALIVAQEIAKEIKKRNPGPDRFFLYRVVRPDDVTFIVREGRLPLEQLIVPGAVFEPIEGFPDHVSAAHAMRRLERGFRTTAGPDVKRLPPFSVMPCPAGRK
jgi:hypothetical protein